MNKWFDTQIQEEEMQANTITSFDTCDDALKEHKSLSKMAAKDILYEQNISKKICSSDNIVILSYCHIVCS